MGGVLFTGCSIYRIDSQDTTLDFYPPKASAKDVIYLEKVDKPYEVIGVISLDAERTRPMDDILEKMRYEAAILGGDAITDIRPGINETNSKKLKLGLASAGIRVRYVAKVIKFK